MIRKIIQIDEEKCNGCGLCAAACHEGAIGMVNGKAKLMRDDYCDGLGDCLPACPTSAIRFVEREAAAYDEAAVKAAQQKANTPKAVGGGCPGAAAKAFASQTESNTQPIGVVTSQLRQWPAQIKLMPIQSDYYNSKGLVVAADCAAYAYGDFHNKFMKGKTTIIGCPKLDGVDYTEKLTEILRQNDITNLTIVRMEVPCCGGLEHAAKTALQKSGKFLPWQVVTLSVNGQILGEG